MQIAYTYAFITKIQAWICYHVTYVALCMKLHINAGRQWVKSSSESGIMAKTSTKRNSLGVPMQTHMTGPCVH